MDKELGEKSKLAKIALDHYVEASKTKVEYMKAQGKNPKSVEDHMKKLRRLNKYR